MPVLLRDIRDWVASLKLAADEHCYCGKLDNKADCSIGTYNLKNKRTPRKIVGGMDNSSYYTKGISFLIHWNKSPSETEENALNFYKMIETMRNVTINGHNIIFAEMLQEEPVSVDTDEHGIYEYVIECIFYVRKE